MTDPIDVSEVEHPDPVPGFAVDEPAVSRRGWPKGKPRGPRKPRVVNTDGTPYEPTAAQQISQSSVTPLTQAPRSYDKQEVQHRLEQVVLGLSGMPAVYRPYFQATPQEATNISEPLAAYLVRRADSSAVVRKVLDEADLFVFVMSLITYVVRVLRDHRAYNARRAQLLAVERAAVVERRRRAAAEGPWPEASVATDNEQRSPSEPADQDAGVQPPTSLTRSAASAPVIPDF